MSERIPDPSGRTLSATAVAPRTPVRRICAHSIALLLVVGVIMVLVDPTVSFSADEGAVIAQVEVLIEEGTWIRPHPVPELDSTGEWFPLEFPVVVEGGAASYVKHPLYPILLLPFAAMAGPPGMVLASVIGTGLCAIGAALLTRRIAPGREVAVLWLTGLGTPLLFDSFLVIAHTLAAAAVAGSAIMALSSVRRPRWWAAALGACGFVAVAVLLRSEAIFVGPALGLGVLVSGSRHRGLAQRATFAAMLAATAGATYLVDSRLSQLVLGEPGSEPFVIRHGGSWLTSRFNGFVNTWLRPTDGAMDLGSAVLFAVPVLVVVLSILLRQRHPDPQRVRFVALLTGACAVIGAALAIDLVVPGLVVAFPSVLLLLVWGGALRRSEAHRLLLVTAGAFCIGVLATQYEQGGTAEWGGRYFALAIPLVTPLLGSVWTHLEDRHGPGLLRPVLAALAVTAFALGAVSINALRVSHERTDLVVAGVIDEVRERTVEEDPIVVSIAALIPRLSWAHLDDARWLFVPPEDLGELYARAEDAGIEEIFIVTPGTLDAWSDSTGAFGVEGVEVVWGQWQVARLVPTA